MLDCQLQNRLNNYNREAIKMSTYVLITLKYYILIIDLAFWNDTK